MYTGHAGSDGTTLFSMSKGERVKRIATHITKLIPVVLMGSVVSAGFEMLRGLLGHPISFFSAFAEWFPLYFGVLVFLGFFVVLRTLSLPEPAVTLNEEGMIYHLPFSSGRISWQEVKAASVQHSLGTGRLVVEFNRPVSSAHRQFSAHLWKVSLSRASGKEYVTLPEVFLPVSANALLHSMQKHLSDRKKEQ